MLGVVSALFIDQLHPVEIKGAVTVSQFWSHNRKCKDESWIKRGPASDQGPPPVQTVVVGRCGQADARVGGYDIGVLELYVHDDHGRLVLSAADGHIDGYRWIEDGGRPMIAGGRAIIGSDMHDAIVIDATRHEPLPDK